MNGFSKSPVIWQKLRVGVAVHVFIALVPTLLPFHASALDAFDPAGWLQLCNAIKQKHDLEAREVPPSFSSRNITSDSSDSFASFTFMGAEFPVVPRLASVTIGDVTSEASSLLVTAESGAKMFMTTNRISAPHSSSELSIEEQFEAEGDLNLAHVIGADLEPNVVSTYETFIMSFTATSDNIRCTEPSIESDILSINALTVSGLDSDAGVVLRDVLAIPGYRGYAFLERLDPSDSDISGDRIEIVMYDSHTVGTLVYTIPSEDRLLLNEIVRLLARYAR